MKASVDRFALRYRSRLRNDGPDSLDAGRLHAFDRLDDDVLHPAILLLDPADVVVLNRFARRRIDRDRPARALPGKSAERGECGGSVESLALLALEHPVGQVQAIVGAESEAAG